jgi:PPOX class probable F420-dependent enzyme
VLLGQSLDRSRLLPKLLDPSREEDIHIDERLRREPVGWLATVRPDRAPRSVPVWFLWEDPVVLVFTGVNTQKVRNIAENPAVWMTLNAAEAGNDFVLLGGTGELVDPAMMSAATTPGFVEKYRGLLRDQTMNEWAAAFSQPIRILVDRVVGWFPCRRLNDAPTRRARSQRASCGTGRSLPERGSCQTAIQRAPLPRTAPDQRRRSGSPQVLGQW